MFKINDKVALTADDIDDLMVAALEGGINYWCEDCLIKKLPGSGELFASHVISKNGVVTLFDLESTKKWDLTLEMFLKGVKMYCEENSVDSGEDLMNSHDAYTADSIIQYAIFDEIIYG